MDIAFVFGLAALWGAMVLLVAGFKKLDKPVGERS